jgi:hypothetical protein
MYLKCLMFEKLDRMLMVPEFKNSKYLQNSNIATGITVLHF